MYTCVCACTSAHIRVWTCICACFHACSCTCVCRWRHLWGSPVGFVPLAPFIGSGLFYVGSLTGMEPTKLARLVSQWALEICLVLEHRNYKHLSPCLLLLCGFRDSNSGLLAWKLDKCFIDWDISTLRTLYILSLEERLQSISHMRPSPFRFLVWYLSGLG